MFIPIGSDAPLYYRPFATIGLIVINVLLFIAKFDSDMDGWQLDLGNGLHPIQWWTSAFYHYGPMHVIGNMVFLWTFGLIVEGKLGWWRFLALYFALAGVDGAVTQSLMLGAEIPSTAGGASGVVYALMAISLVWAPKNDIDIFYCFILGIMLRTGVFQVSIMAFAAFYIGLDFVIAAIRGFEMSTEVLHVLGAALGFPAACLLLKWNLVDCEGWDAFSLWRGRTLVDELAGPAMLRSPRPNPDADAVVMRPRRVGVEKRLRQLHEGLAARNPLGAWAAYQDLRERGKHTVIDDATLRKLIDTLRAGQDWGGLLFVLEDYIARCPDEADRARLILAEILIRREQRPRAALKVLEPLQLSRVSETERTLARKLKAYARTQIDAGVMELASPQ